MRVRHRHYSPVAPDPMPPDLFSTGQRLSDLYWIKAPAQRVDTSLAAAAKITKHTARIREAIFLFIRATGGATAGEIANGCGLNPSTVRPRLLELQGRAKWAPGLPARIQRSPEVRKHMHVYGALP